MHLPINNIYNMKQIDKEPSLRTTKHEKIRPRYIIARVNTNKQVIDLTKTMNCVQRKWGKIGISPRVSKRGAEAAENSWRWGGGRRSGRGSRSTNSNTASPEPATEPRRLDADPHGEQRRSPGNTTTAPATYLVDSSSTGAESGEEGKK
jgi:hypothetical protein